MNIYLKRDFFIPMFQTENQFLESELNKMINVYMKLITKTNCLIIQYNASDPKSLSTEGLVTSLELLEVSKIFKLFILHISLVLN